MSEKTLLEIRDLAVRFVTDDGIVRAVDGLNLDLREGETVGLVGESGCGKSVSALSILRIVPPPGHIVSGRIQFDGRDLLRLTERELRDVRGGRIAMIFQEPMTSLNPVFTVGYQIEEAIHLHQRKKGREARRIAVEMLAKVGIGNPDQRAREYAHQLSGGMKQRAMIAMALVSTPSLLIADEPTTALDVTIQAQILELLRELQHTLHMSVLLITHNLGVVAEMTRRVAVMYAGRIVESARTPEIFSNPAHPYTRGLLACIPAMRRKKETLSAIPGQVPNMINLPPGCRFQPRCSLAVPICAQEKPQLREVAPDHHVACYRV